MIMIDLATLPPQTAQAIRHGEIVQFVENGKPIIHEEPMLNTDVKRIELEPNQYAQLLERLEQPPKKNAKLQQLLSLTANM